MSLAMVKGPLPVPNSYFPQKLSWNTKYKIMNTYRHFLICYIVFHRLRIR